MELVAQTDPASRCDGWISSKHMLRIIPNPQNHTFCVTKCQWCDRHFYWPKKALYIRMLNGNELISVGRMIDDKVKSFKTLDERVAYLNQMVSSGMVSVKEIGQLMADTYEGIYQVHPVIPPKKRNWFQQWWDEMKKAMGFS